MLTPVRVAEPFAFHSCNTAHCRPRPGEMTDDDWQ